MGWCGGSIQAASEAWQAKVGSGWPQASALLRARLSGALAALFAGAKSEPERQQKGAGEEFAEQLRREVGVEAVRVVGVDLDKELFFELRPGLREPLRFPFAKELDELSAGVMTA